MIIRLFCIYLPGFMCTVMATAKCLDLFHFKYQIQALYLKPYHIMSYVPWYLLIYLVDDVIVFGSH